FVNRYIYDPDIEVFEDFADIIYDTRPVLHIHFDDGTGFCNACKFQKCIEHILLSDDAHDSAAGNDRHGTYRIMIEIHCYFLDEVERMTVGDPFPHNA